MEKEHKLAETSEKMELIGSLRDSLMGRELQCKELSEKLLHSEQEVRLHARLGQSRCRSAMESVTPFVFPFSAGERLQEVQQLRETVH